MTTWTENVFSSNVQSVGYDTETQELIVTWISGKRSAYAGVPEETAVQLFKAASVGQMLNSEIKPRYSHRYV